MGKCSVLLPLVAIALLACPAGCGSRPASPPAGAPASPPAAGSEPTAAPPDGYANAREAMVAEQIAARGVVDPAVLEAMRRVPRHRFVPDPYLPDAYADHPLPIGYGQTISQPYIVAVMTEALNVGPGARVLEIGTGSGYQAAVLADLGVQVYSVEIIPELAEAAAQRLAETGYGGVAVLAGDGYFGWADHAPYDAIIVTAAPDHLPQPLVGQLKDGGRIIIPIGPPGAYQTLWQFEKHGGDLRATDLGGVSFVPFTGAGQSQ